MVHKKYMIYVICHNDSNCCFDYNGLIGTNGSNRCNGNSDCTGEFDVIAVRAVTSLFCFDVDRF